MPTIYYNELRTQKQTPDFGFFEKMLGGLITGAVVFALEAQVSSFVLFDLEILHIFRVFLYGERNESRWNAPTRLISFVFSS